MIESFENLSTILDTTDITLHFSTANFSHDNIGQLRKSLSSDEKERAEQFLFVSDVELYILCHSILRLFLAKYLAIPVSSIVFKRDKYNKPYMEGNKIFFNISHSGNMGVIAISRNGNIGVDIEKIKPEFEFSSIVEEYFLKDEIQKILSSEEPTKEFYKFWTRKEALLKATGIGLSANLKGVDVTKSSYSQNSSEKNKYYLTTIELDNYLLSVASLSNSQIKYYQLKPENIYKIF